MQKGIEILFLVEAAMDSDHSRAMDTVPPSRRAAQVAYHLSVCKVLDWKAPGNFG